jgi:hypothetical protein
MPGDSYLPDGDTAALYAAYRTGAFPRAFARMWISGGTAECLGADDAWLEQLGADLEAALAVRGQHAKAITRLRALSARLVKDAKHPDRRKAAEFFVQWVCDLQADIQRRQAGLSDAGKLPRAWGVVLALVEQYRQRDVPYDLKAIASAVAVVLPGEDISATDVERAIETYTRAAPLHEWLPAQ